MNEESPKKEILKRSTIFITLMTLAISLCALHGILAKEKTNQTIDQMIHSGHLTGKFWRIVRSDHKGMIIEKYNLIVAINCSPPEDFRIGDRVSFIATLNNGTSNLENTWQPKIIHFHGNSTFKFYLSFLAVLIVLIICIRHFKFNRSSFSLTIK